MSTTWTLEMRDGQSDETVTLTADEQPDHDACDTACEAWASGGDWGDEGVEVEVWWELLDADGNEVDEGITTVSIDPDHDALVKASGGDTTCDHDWTSEGEGGCRENPGVWSTGGTSMTFATHCRTCGLHRVERSTGCQKNPGEHDTVHYTQPESWCAECESGECSCEPAEVDADE